MFNQIRVEIINCLETIEDFLTYESIIGSYVIHFLLRHNIWHSVYNHYKLRAGSYYIQYVFKMINDAAEQHGCNFDKDYKLHKKEIDEKGSTIINRLKIG